ncbi:hypothetical protein ACJX0J_034579, partial [Zea mays]
KIMGKCLIQGMHLVIGWICEDFEILTHAWAWIDLHLRVQGTKLMWHKDRGKLETSKRKHKISLGVVQRHFHELGVESNDDGWKKTLHWICMRTKRDKGISFIDLLPEDSFAPI